MTYEMLINKIKSLRTSLKYAQTQEEINYFEMELMVAEEYFERIMSRGRR